LVVVEAFTVALAATMVALAATAVAGVMVVAGAEDWAGALVASAWDSD
jgi:hypothetical protein